MNIRNNKINGVVLFAVAVVEISIDFGIRCSENRVHQFTAYWNRPVNVLNGWSWNVTRQKPTTCFNPA